MAIDEFGREIPVPAAAATGRQRRDGRSSPSPPMHRSTSRHYAYETSARIPSHLNEALPTSRDDDDRDRDRGRDHRGGRDRHHHRSRHHHDDRPTAPTTISRKRKHTSESPLPPPRRGGPASHHTKPKKKPHPSTIYAEEPMLCQYLWKEANPKDEQDDVKKTEEKPDNEDNDDVDNIDKDDTATNPEYDEYRKLYCLNYVRMFFNEHMDDSWFRDLYSPLAKYRYTLQERNRSRVEAIEFTNELQSSITKQQQTTAGSSSSDPSFFVLKARLGGGIRQSTRSDYHSSGSLQPHKASQQSLVNPIPATHVLAFTNQILPIQEIPHYVTDEQLTTALLQHVSLKTSKATDATNSCVLYSGPPAKDLTRNAYLCGPEEVRNEIIQSLNHLDRGGAAAAAAATAENTGASAHVPRKEDTYVPKKLELIVECSDAYGRLEVDADGKGGEPDERDGVPSRKATVWISTQSISPTVTVLSAALSSKTRIQQDQESALKLAMAYDRRKGIPEECRLETLLPKAIPRIASLLNGNSQEIDDPPSAQDIEDALDVTIAYLRRVHLFSFYNACAVASRVGEVLNGNHAASTIHLRLANADELLEPMEEAEDGTGPVVDLLVQRLNDSIEKALEETSSWDENSSKIAVDKETDIQAKEIEFEESQVEGGWIEDHALIDEDGRARCSFHFCRKLFKDSTFLKKHLMKKHSEFLKAEIAKCHDNYMMKAWDGQEFRPVPPVLVDCGHRFGLKPSPVIGAAEPIAADPEPELWKREEERRELAEKEAEARRERQSNYHHQHHRHNNNIEDSAGPTLDGPLSEDRGHSTRPQQRAKSNFVDVDDMKEEKVEMAFDSVEIPVQPPKKKKKKKLL